MWFWVWGHYDREREIKAKGVVLPDRALAGQGQEAAHERKKKRTLDSVC